MGIAFIPSAGSASSDLSAKVAQEKYCVIIRPAASGEFSADQRPPVHGHPLSPDHAGNPLVSFFRGQVKKVGFGAPKSFSITQVIPHSLPEEALLSPRSASLGNREENGRDTRCFFPSVGYYSRFSQNGNQAVAIGVGLRGPDPENGQDLPTTPEAGVAVMVGFAF
jgi:hypothetical protein